MKQLHISNATCKNTSKGLVTIIHNIIPFKGQWISYSQKLNFHASIQNLVHSEYTYVYRSYCLIYHSVISKIGQKVMGIMFVFHLWLSHIPVQVNIHKCMLYSLAYLVANSVVQKSIFAVPDLVSILSTFPPQLSDIRLSRADSLDASTCLGRPLTITTRWTL